MRINILFRTCLRKINAAILCIFSILILSSFCSSSSSSSPSGSTQSGDSDNNAAYQTKFKLEYSFGTYSEAEYKNIYVIWVENSTEGFYYPVYVCEKLLDGSLTGTVLPYWKVNKYPEMNAAEVDAVTGATKRLQDFSVSFTVPDNAPEKFTVYFETDVSFNENDWFYDQPAVLFKADIDRDDPKTEYRLEFAGWTPNETAVTHEATDNNIADIDLVLGVFQGETRYITNYKDMSSTTSDTFSGADSRAQSTELVGSIRVIPDN